MDHYIVASGCKPLHFLGKQQTPSEEWHIYWRCWVKVKWLIMDAKYLKGKIRIYPMDDRLGKCLCTSLLGWWRVIKHRWSNSPNFDCFRKIITQLYVLGSPWIFFLTYLLNFGRSLQIWIWLQLSGESLDVRNGISQHSAHWAMHVYMHGFRKCLC